jgi:uncharacterized protein (TIGR02646 family)
MIRLLDRALPPDLQQHLDGLQARLDAEADYARRVELAASTWRNRTRSGDLERIRDALYEMCFGPRRCVYCEDSASTQIEHVRPRSLYPEATFSWENFLPACSGCNTPKNNRFAVFVPQQPDPVQVARRRVDPVVPPRHGEPLLIQPRREDPMHFLILDLNGTFHIVPRPGLEHRERTRATWTIDTLLCLNREPLPQGRQQAFQGYRAQLLEYIHKRDAHSDPALLQNHVEGIQRTGHRFVWEQMKEQCDRHPDLRALFAQAPEARDWPPLPWRPTRTA